MIIIQHNVFNFLNNYYLKEIKGTLSYFSPELLKLYNEKKKEGLYNSFA